MNKLDLRLQAENNTYTFLIGGLAENTKRRRQQSVRISVRNSVTERIVTVPEGVRSRDYCDERGDLCYLLSIRMERNSLREYEFSIPGPVMEWMDPGSRVSLRVERLEDDGTVSAAGVLPLLADTGGALVRYSEEQLVSCLLTGRTAEKLLSFLRNEAGSLAQENVRRILDSLCDSAGKDMSGHADFSLYQLYHDERFALASEQEAGQWLYKAAQKHYPEAVRALREAPAAYQPPAAEKLDSMDVCLASAEGGSRDAQFQLYQHYSSRESGDYDAAKALKWLRSAAENGHDEAVEGLLAHYLNDHMVDAQTQSFLDLLEKAAEKGSAHAHLLLFRAYYTGECLRRPCRKEKRLALGRLQSAAAAGNVDACYLMWQLFEDGNDLLISEKDAVAMLTRASDSGSCEAMNDLGELYVTGRIVQKQSQKGVDLIREAASLGCFKAQMRVYRMWYDGRYYDVLLDTDRAKAYGLAQAYAREDGNPLAQTMLWETYTNQNPVMLTRFEALGYLEEAARQSHTPAMFQLASAYLTGVYRDADTEEGFRLLKSGARLGCADAQLALFRLYYTGRYYALARPVNKERAYKWIALSAASNPQALYEMWELFLAGNEMELDAADALEMLFASAGKKCCDALYAVALLFARGEFVEADLERALKHLTRAAAYSHPKSMFKLYEAYTAGCLENQPLEKDPALAERMLLLSAQLGYAPACATVCGLFEKGDRIRADRTFADECRSKIPADWQEEEGRPADPPSPPKTPKPEKKAPSEAADNAP